MHGAGFPAQESKVSNMGVHVPEAQYKLVPQSLSTVHASPSDPTGGKVGPVGAPVGNLVGDLVGIKVVGGGVLVGDNVGAFVCVHLYPVCVAVHSYPVGQKLAAVDSKAGEKHSSPGTRVVRLPFQHCL